MIHEVPALPSSMVAHVCLSILFNALQDKVFWSENHQCHLQQHIAI